jgi:hypothetical protein
MHNYNKGYIGFVYDNNCLLSKIIAYATKSERVNNIKISHVFLIISQNKCIEVDAIKNKVVESHLNKYINNKRYQVFLRKPINLTDDVANSIVFTAKNQLGKKYNKRKIIQYAIGNSIFGKFIGGIFTNSKNIKAEGDCRWICSDFIAYCLNQQSEYKEKGVLKNNIVTPQSLFADAVVFEN